MKHITELSECPHCGHDEWYAIQRVSGKIYYNTRFDGKETDNGEMYEGLKYVYASRFAHCSQCHRKIGKL